jgi:hypothetical protein
MKTLCLYRRGTSGRTISLTLKNGTNSMTYVHTLDMSGKKNLMKKKMTTGIECQIVLIYDVTV